MTKRAAIYVRVSSERQAGEDRVSPQSQLADCREHCEKRGYKIVAEIDDIKRYRSKGRLVNPSGTRKDRPGYLELLRMARNGEIDVIVAWKEDRLYRGLYAAMPLSELLDEQGKALEVDLVRETFDHKMLGIKASIGKMEIDNIKERMVMGRRARLERGEIPGGPTKYGYWKSEGNKNAIDEREAKIVRQIFNWYLEGVSLMEMRRRLNAGKTSPRSGKLWSKATITKIIYSGDFYATGRYETRLADESFSIACPTIISMDTWRQACELREKHSAYRGRNVKQDYLCRGLVTCSCGWIWGARSVYRDGKPTKAGYYSCARLENQPEKREADCPKSIGSGKLDDFVWRYVKGIVLHPEILQEAIDDKLAELEAEDMDMGVAAERAQKLLDDFSDERQWIIRRARTKQITEDDMNFQLAEIEFNRLDLEKQLADLEAAAAARSQAEVLKQWAAEYLEDIGQGLALLDTPPSELNEETREHLFVELGASQFLEKFEGDRKKAFAWAHLEKRRKVVSTLVRKVVVSRDKDGERYIAPEVVVDVPIPRRDILSYGYQSLEYVQQSRDAALAASAN
jgi:site-specific DNA recombinase